MRRLLPMLALTACNKGSVRLDLNSAKDVQQACEDREDEIQTDTIRVTFEATTGGCAWEEDGNLAAQDGYLTARVEQTEGLGLGADQVVCDMDFAFAGDVGLEQDIVYDDNFLFTFNDVVLAASYGPWVEALPADGNLRIYDWESIAGLENLFDSSIPTYCLGAAAGLAECEIPPPETTGPIKLAFDTSVTSTLSYTAIDQDRFDFGFIATGDNDPTTDCSHETFYFDVTVPYFEI